MGSEPEMPEMDEVLKATSADYSRGWYAALDHVCHFINALDSEGMAGRDVRSAIYSECLESRPRRTPAPSSLPDELTERIMASIGKQAAVNGLVFSYDQVENGIRVALATDGSEDE